MNPHRSWSISWLVAINLTYKGKTAEHLEEEQDFVALFFKSGAQTSREWERDRERIFNYNPFIILKIVIVWLKPAGFAKDWPEIIAGMKITVFFQRYPMAMVVVVVTNRACVRYYTPLSSRTNGGGYSEGERETKQDDNYKCVVID